MQDIINTIPVIDFDYSKIVSESKKITDEEIERYLPDDLQTVYIAIKEYFENNHDNSFYIDDYNSVMTIFRAFALDEQKLLSPNHVYGNERLIETDEYNVLAGLSIEYTSGKLLFNETKNFGCYLERRKKDELQLRNDLIEAYKQADNIVTKIAILSYIKANFN